MSQGSNSDDDNVSLNTSSDQNDSESEKEEIIKNKKRSQIESDSNDSDNKIKNDKIKKNKSKNILNSSSDDKSGSDDSDSEKSTKSNKDKSDNDKSDNDKSDDNKSDDDKSDDEIFDEDEDKDEDKDVDKDVDDDEDEDDIRRKKIKTENQQDDDDDDDEELIKRERNVDQDDDELNRDIFQQFEEEQQPETETRIDVTIPKITTDLGKESHFVKLPNFLSVDTHPYDPSWYEDEIDDDEVLDEEGRARMKLKVENTIRWRNVVDKDGNQQKESNARVVKWSDGSMSLHLGSEIFDIHKQPILGGDNNHLYIRQGTGLLGQSVFKTKLTFRPHSTDSFTHKKMTLSLADRSQKTQKIRVLPTVGFDPEANRTDRIKKEEDKLRASLRRENKARRVRERVNQRGPTTSYLEPDIDDEDGAISISAIKNKFKQRGQSYAEVYSDDDSDSASSNGSIFNKKKATSTKKANKITESDEDQ